MFGCRLLKLLGESRRVRTEVWLKSKVNKNNIGEHLCLKNVGFESASLLQSGRSTGVKINHLFNPTSSKVISKLSCRQWKASDQSRIWCGSGCLFLQEVWISPLRRTNTVVSIYTCDLAPTEEFDPRIAAAGRSEGTATAEEDGVFTGETTHHNPWFFDHMWHKTGVYSSRTSGSALISCQSMCR